MIDEFLVNMTKEDLEAEVVRLRSQIAILKDELNDKDKILTALREANFKLYNLKYEDNPTKTSIRQEYGI